MKNFTVTTTAEAFVSALKNCRPEKKDTIPVLTYAKIDGNQLIGTDLDLWTIGTFKGSGSKESFLIPCSKVLSVLTGEKGKLTITATIPKDGLTTPYVTLMVNGCEFKFDTIRETNFPQMPKLAKTTLVINGDVFSAMIDRTRFAVSREESRYTLNAALLKVTKEHVTMVATDGHRLALTHTRNNDDGVLPETKIGTAALDYLRKRIKSSPVFIGVSADGTHQTFKADGMTVISRATVGTFPNYDAIMPQNHTIRATIPSCAALYPVLARVARCADSRSGAVKWAFDAGLKLSASSIDSGSATSTVACSVDSGQVTMGLNAPYILDFLKVAGDVPVEVLLKSHDAAALFTVANGDYKYLVMPMRM